MTNLLNNKNIFTASLYLYAASFISCCKS